MEGVRCGGSGGDVMGSLVPYEALWNFTKSKNNGKPRFDEECQYLQKER